MLCRTSNRSMLALSRSEKCAFVLARSSKLSFFVRSCSLEVQIRVRYSEILAEHINVFRILLHKSTTYLMFVPLDVQISNAWLCSCSKILKNRRSYSLHIRKIFVRHNTTLPHRYISRSEVNYVMLFIHNALSLFDSISLYINVLLLSSKEESLVLFSFLFSIDQGKSIYMVS